MAGSADIGPKPTSLKFLTQDQVRALLNAPRKAGCEFDYYFFSMTYYLALRGSETSLLRPDHFREEDVLVASAKKRAKAFQGYPKCDFSKRPLLTVPILFGESVMRAAVRWCRERKRKSAWMFPSVRSVSRPVNDHGMRQRFHKWATKVGLDPRVTTHSLRHSCASHVIEMADADVIFMRDFLRHSNLVTTSVYLHTMPRRIHEIRQRMKDLKSGGR